MLYLHDVADDDGFELRAKTSTAANQTPPVGGYGSTLESVSARSFGFVRPKEKLNGVRRHKSFFFGANVEREAPLSGSMTPAQRMAAAFRKANGGIRRAESFSHGNGGLGGRGLGDFDFIGGREGRYRPAETDFRAGRGKSVERLQGGSSLERKLSKAKSMEFLKAKWLKSKRSAKAGPWEPTQSHRSTSPVSSSTPTSSVASSAGAQRLKSMENANANRFDHRTRHFDEDDGDQDDIYDWRQDTPFWNKRGRWARPAPASKVKAAATEDPWTHLHGRPPPSVKQYPVNGGAVPPGWPAHGYPSYPVPSVPVAALQQSGAPGQVYLPPSHHFAPRPFVSPAVAANSFGSSGGSGLGRGSRQSSSSSSSAAGRRRRGSSAGRARAAGPSAVSSEDVTLSSRLEITELSDEDDVNVPSPDYPSVEPVIPKLGSRDNLLAARRNILDMPSGLY